MFRPAAILCLSLLGLGHEGVQSLLLEAGRIEVLSQEPV